MQDLGPPTVLSLQAAINKVLNERLPDDWGAFRCTDRDGMEYVEVANTADREERFIITIVKGMK